FLDPLTGVQGHKYYSRKSDHFLTDGILVSLREGSLEMINRELGYQYGNLLVFTLGRILESRFKHVMRTSLHGSKFLILDDDRSLFNTVHMILTRSSVRTSNGYEIKGIGIDVLSARGVKFYDKYYTLISEPDIFIFWGHSVDSRIYRIAQLSETVEWFDTYECGRFTWRIEDKILKHLLNI
ncbi:hypothetical protein KAU34_04105, partial [candidate division WOR-3 bacterium]|nr:hypothetical protein [candidate division WOR-3 bacterium]